MSPTVIRQDYVHMFQEYVQGLLLNKNDSYKTAVLAYIRHRIPHKVGPLVTCITLRIDKIQQPRLSVQEVVTVFLDDNSGFIL